MVAELVESPVNVDGPLMSMDEVDRYIHHAMQAPILGVDTETTGIEGIKSGRDYLTGISISFDLTGAGYFSAYFPFRHRALDHQNLSIPEVLPKLATLLKEKPHSFHHRKFDLHSLATIGIKPSDLHPHSDCSMVMAHLWNEELPSKELDWLSKRYLNDRKADKDVTDAFGKAMGWDNIPAYLMAGRAKHDATLALRLRNFIWDKIKADGLDALWPIEREFGTLLYNMEATGVGIDVDFCSRKSEQGRSRMGVISRELGFDPGSSNDLSEFLFHELELPILKVGKPSKSWPDGRPSMAKAVMEEYEDILSQRELLGTLNPSHRNAVQLVLEYRGWQKAVTSLYESMLEKVDPDGRVRTNFNQHRTVTGRLASNGPNLQQIPRKSVKEWNGDAKRAFHAGDDDFELWGYDYSQLEFRLAASYGSEQHLLDEFAKVDGDVFTAMAQASGLDRQTIKTKTYATLYGAGLPKIAATLGMTPDDAQPLYERFLDTIPGIRRVSKVATQKAKQRGFVQYWTGRRRHFPYDEGHHKAFNSVLQGGAAELVKQSQLRCREVESSDCQMVLQVHDEIVFRIRKGTREQVEPEIIERMTNWPQFPVKFAVEGKLWNQ